MLNIALVTNMLNKLEPYAYFFEKWVHIKEFLIKLNVCIFLITDEQFLVKYN